MREKLVIIAIIQSTIENMRNLLADTQHSPEKLGALKGVAFCLVSIYTAITGEPWTQSPQELTQWMIRYMKEEAKSLGDEKIVTLN